MARAKDDSRLNALFVLLALKNHSNEEHPLSVDEIRKFIALDFNKSIEEVFSERTIMRTMDALLESPELMLDEDSAMYTDPGNLGFNIRTSGRGRYFYDSNFSASAIQALKDAIEIHQYFAKEDIADIVGNLVKLRPQDFSERLDSKEDDARMDEQDTVLFMNIEIVMDLIKSGNYVEIIYCNYGPDMKLHARKGYESPKIIKPLGLMWSNGYYYLHTYMPSRALFKKDATAPKQNRTPVNLRLDRILIGDEIAKKNIPSVVKKACPKSLKEGKIAYRAKHPVMYAGDEMRVELLIRDNGVNGMLNACVDTFGNKLKMKPVSLLDYKKYLSGDIAKSDGETWYKVSLSTAPGGLILFATQYMSDCVVISPKSVVDGVKRNIKTGTALYGK